jgi:hypothetical protein
VCVVVCLREKFTHWRWDDWGYNSSCHFLATVLLGRGIVFIRCGLEEYGSGKSVTVGSQFGVGTVVWRVWLPGFGRRTVDLNEKAECGASPLANFSC